MSALPNVGSTMLACTGENHYALVRGETAITMCLEPVPDELLGRLLSCEENAMMGLYEWLEAGEFRFVVAGNDHALFVTQKRKSGELGPIVFFDLEMLPASSLTETEASHAMILLHQARQVYPAWRDDEACSDLDQITPHSFQISPESMPQA